ncbi:hypothetical protein ABIA32_003303 [Streptacidiphilus sp. MAP12-20]|uniref:hypothetical protein n=1 Tax=Streptacidiphilus sp. MAP12-20 TaxID=3156299 RepID=UPI003515A498
MTMHSPDAVALAQGASALACLVAVALAWVLLSPDVRRQLRASVLVAMVAFIVIVTPATLYAAGRV